MNMAKDDIAIIDEYDQGWNSYFFHTIKPIINFKSQ